MTNTRAHGFDNPAQLREYLDELEAEPAKSDTAEEEFEEYDPAAALREIGWLRKEVADLRAQYNVQGEQTNDLLPSRVNTRPWIWLATAVAAALLVRRVARSIPKN
jgi:hypothetical protein